MKQVRKALFETNSSSTHAIVIPRRKLEKEDYDLRCSWCDCSLEFGRETYRMVDTWDLKLAYIYQILLSSDNSTLTPDLDKFKKQVNDIYAELNSENEEIRSLGYNELVPEQLFTVLDYIDKKDRGLIPRDQKPDFGINNIVDYPNRLIDLCDNSYCYVDHAEYFFIYEGDDKRLSFPCAEFINKLLNDEEYLKKFIFGSDSYITIGGDEYRGYNLKTVGFEYDYDNPEDWEKRVEEYKKDYEVYFKGN